MRDPFVGCLRLVSLPDGENYSFVSTEGLDTDIRNRHRDRYMSKLIGWSSSWPAGSVNAACPHPVLVTKRHQEQLKELHLAIDLAIEDIVDRWWADEEAQFPRRMPLEPEEEELLRVSFITPFLSRYGRQNTNLQLRCSGLATIRTYLDHTASGKGLGDRTSSWRMTRPVQSNFAFAR